MFEDDHGDDRHITIQDLQAAADAAGVTVEEVANNLKEAAGQAQPAGTRQE
ncbi:MAG TPA: hypothetical protein VFP63_06795 [Dehalococcoidia bacterium]|nr:hypothetical protein [Dehalococcoidia bacterium]